jgi:NADH dehydrogenase/NADH:ubiquinone oxidoreductase subunit G
VKLTIDGRRVEARTDESVLDCALRHGIGIPRLCTHPHLPPFGACRMCIVEVEGTRGFPTACTTAAEEGMVVRTDTPALQELRRGVLELILVEHPSACLVCDKDELCEKYRPAASKAGRTTGCHTCNKKEDCDLRTLSRDLQVKELPVPPAYRGLALERSDPFIDRDLNLCILCGRCVRICKAHHGWATIDFVGRGVDTHIGEAFGRSLVEAGCRFCGSCVDVCPTGSLADRYGKWYGAPRRVTATTCVLCDAACAIEIGASHHGRAFQTRAISGKFPICVLGRFGLPEFLGGVERLSKPKLRVQKVLREHTWEAALAEAAEKLKPFVGGAFAFLCDTTSTLEDRYVFERFTHEVMKSPHFAVIESDERGVSRGSLPAGVKAAVMTGEFVDAAKLDALELLVVIDCYPTRMSERADVVLPAAVLAEVAGTAVDDDGRMRPLHRSCVAPGEARPDLQIVSDLARIMGSKGFAWDSARAVAREMKLDPTELRIMTNHAPPAALDPGRRRTHFRGHRIEDRVRGLSALGTPEDSVARIAAGG